MDWKDWVMETPDNEAMFVSDIWLTYTVRLATYGRMSNTCQVEKVGLVLDVLKEGRVSVHGKP